MLSSSPLGSCIKDRVTISWDISESPGLWIDSCPLGPSESFKCYCSDLMGLGYSLGTGISKRFPGDSNIQTRSRPMALRIPSFPGQWAWIAWTMLPRFLSILRPHYSLSSFSSLLGIFLILVQRRLASNRQKMYLFQLHWDISDI